jgi:GT2 family glycosyltransferase
MIATRNRRDELVKTLESCCTQDYPLKETHVVDDCSTDGTFEEVRARFPEVAITRNERPLGSVESRNLIFDRVHGDVLVGFDDDSRFMERDATRRVVDRLAQEPDLGLLTFQDIGPEHPDRLPGGQGLLVGEWHTPSYGAGRFAMKRAALRAAGKYPSFFWHAYEEPDLALRVWDAGYRCLQWNDILVWHEFSGLNRNERRTHSLHARNEQLSNWMRTPWPYVLPLTAWRAAAQLRYSIKRGWWTAEPQVWWASLRLAPTAWRHRKAVKVETFRRCLRLSRLRIVDPREAWALGR